jgi:hypothetical protein
MRTQHAPVIIARCRRTPERRTLPNRGLHDFPPTLVMPVQITIVSRASREVGWPLMAHEARACPAPVLKVRPRPWAMLFFLDRADSHRRAR